MLSLPATQTLHTISPIPRRKFIFSAYMRHASLFRASTPSPRDPPRATSAGLPETLNGDSAVFTELMHVRDYELGQEEVVNNAVFASYLQHARHRYLEMLTGSHHAAKIQAPAWALAELRLKYLAPLRSGDAFVVCIKCIKTTPVRVTTEEHVVRLPRSPGEKETLAVVAEATVVSLDERYRPKRISRELLTALRHGKPMAGVLEGGGEQGDWGRRRWHF